MPDKKNNFEIIEFLIPLEAVGERLDKYIGLSPDINLTRNRVQKLIESGMVSLDGRLVGHNQILKGGERLKIKIPPDAPSAIIPENIPLEIVYEDDALLVVNKPAGMVTHPATGNFAGTLVNALMHYTKDLSHVSGIERAGIVHRLDKNTSGLILVAKNDQTQLYLQKELQARNIKRIYMALVCGHMKKVSGEIDLPIGRSLKDRKKMTVTDRKARAAKTSYKLKERFKLYDLLEVSLLTGRTHQIRVHFAHLGHPVFGDPEYGGRLKWHQGIFSVDKRLALKALDIMPRQALHARRLEFKHPVSGETIVVESELPDDFKSLLELLKAE